MDFKILFLWLYYIYKLKVLIVDIVYRILRENFEKEIFIFLLFKCKFYVFLKYVFYLILMYFKF